MYLYCTVNFVKPINTFDAGTYSIMYFRRLFLYLPNDCALMLIQITFNVSKTFTELQAIPNTYLLLESDEKCLSFELNNL